MKQIRRLNLAPAIPRVPSPANGHRGDYHKKLSRFISPLEATLIYVLTGEVKCNFKSPVTRLVLHWHPNRPGPSGFDAKGRPAYGLTQAQAEIAYYD
jgi:hypothetical protein